MDWLTQLTQRTAVIVPTRSLANSLQEQLATFHQLNNRQVWEAPTIVVWQDYLQQLWLANKNSLDSVYQAINTQQSLLLWHRVLEASRHQESEFTLLDVQQTALAMQRSWRLLHDWSLDMEVLKQDAATDTQQFIYWCEAYIQLLEERSYLDGPLLAKTLLESETILPFKHIIWYAYDLKTAQQTAFDRLSEAQGIAVENRAVENRSTNSALEKAAPYFSLYESRQQELQTSLLTVRSLIEKDPNVRVNLVVPDLQHTYNQVNKVVQDVFYPGVSPTELQSMPTAYRFSLGQALPLWPAIDNALRLLKLLKNRIAITDFTLLLRSEYITLYQHNEPLCLSFIRWLQNQRMTYLSFERLLEQVEAFQQVFPDTDTKPLLAWLTLLCEQYDALKERLAKSRYHTQSFSDWAELFVEWLNSCGWRPSARQAEFNSLQFQLFDRWGKLLDDYRGLTRVQQTVGLNRALEILTQMAHDAVFLPKAPASPLLISGIYEAIGQTADYCFVIGMDDTYPASVSADAFIPNRLLQAQGYPEASHEGSFEQAKKVIRSLLNGATNSFISYASMVSSDDQAERNASPLFRNKVFREAVFTQAQIQSLPGKTKPTLEPYQDTVGLPWSKSQTIKGGARIFEDQSNCAFKAFVTHQLNFEQHYEAEFGLDALDRGNVAHSLLQGLWQQIQTQNNLLKMAQGERLKLVEATVNQFLADNPQSLNSDKLKLLKYEQTRLVELLMEWLSVDEQRPTPFVVLEMEEQRESECGGIRFRYIVDRLDALEDGRTVIIDYKTGYVDRKNWLGERIKKPQLPLYSTALQSAKQKGVSGIAYGKVQRHNSEYIGLGETGIFKRTRDEVKYEQQWQEGVQQWPAKFAQLAQDFLQGKAEVNPIDKTVCDYCELHSLCRVSQLRQTNTLNLEGASDDQ